MKSAALCIVLILLSACLWAQAPAPAPAPAEPAPPMHHSMHHDMGAMHDQHMQEMKAQVEKMRATLEQMKATIAKEKSTSENQLERQNIELWESMIKHMEGMVEMMSHHPGTEMGMMHPGMDGMKGGCCSGMKDGGVLCRNERGRWLLRGQQVYAA